MEDEFAKFASELEGLGGGNSGEGGSEKDTSVQAAEAAGPRPPAVVSKTISAPPQRATAPVEQSKRVIAQQSPQPPAHSSAQPRVASTSQPHTCQPGAPPVASQAPPPPPPAQPRIDEDRNEQLRQATMQANAQAHAEHVRALAAASQAAARPPPSGLPYGQQQPNGQKKAVKRVAAGEMWEDSTLADWPDNDFRLFVGNLGNDASDALLSGAFSKYPSFQRARVVRDKRTNKPKGYGFVSFAEPWDMTKAMREMDNKYVGSRPVKLKKSTWADRNVNSAKQSQWEYHKVKFVKPTETAYDSTTKRYKRTGADRPTLR